jgi:hypothetical protein
VKTIRINGEDVPVIDAVKSVTIISNKITGVKYANEEEWKTLGIDPNEIRRDVKVTIPKLDLFAKTKY